MLVVVSNTYSSVRTHTIVSIIVTENSLHCLQHQTVLHHHGVHHHLLHSLQQVLRDHGLGLSLELSHQLANSTRVQISRHQDDPLNIVGNLKYFSIIRFK